MKKVMLLTVVLMLFLAACGGDSEPEPDVQSFEETANAEIGLSIGYPPGWQTKTEAGEEGVVTMNLASSAELLANVDDSSVKLDEGAIVTILGMDKDILGFMAPDGMNTDNPVELVELFSGLMMEDDLGDFTLTQEAAAVTLNGAQGAKAIYDASGDEGDGVMQLIALPNENVVIFLFTVVADASDEELSPVIESILNSITLSTPTMVSVMDGLDDLVVEEETAVIEETAVVEATVPDPTPEPAPTDAPEEAVEPEPTSEPVAELFVPTEISLDSGAYIYSNGNELGDMAVYDGKIWGVGTGGVVSYDLDSGEATKYTTLNGLPHGAVFGIDVCPIPEATLVVGTYYGLAIYDAASDSFVDGDSIYRTDNRVLDLECNENMLVAYDDDGVNVYHPDTGVIDFYDDDLLAWVNIESITIAGDDIWLPTGYSGATLIRNGEATIYNVENGNFPSDDVDSIAVASNGDLWLGAGEGLFRVTPAGETTLWDKDSSPDISYFGPGVVAFAPDGSLWAGFSSTLCQWDMVNGRCSQYYSGEANQASGSINSILFDENGTIYTQTYSEGMNTFDGAAFAHYYMEGEYPSNFVEDIIEDVDGNIWTIGDGVIRTDLEGSFWERTYEAYGNDIIADPAGGVWLAGGTNLFHLTDAGITENYSEEDGIYDAYVQSVEMDNQGRIWLGQEDGITIFDGNDFTILGPDEGWPEGNVNDLLADGDTMWAAASGQLVKVDGTDLSWEIIFDENNNGGLNQTYFGDMELYDDGLLVEASGGLYFYDGASLSKFQGADCNVGQVEVDRQNNVWLNCFGDIFGSVGTVLSDSGVYVWMAADGEWVSITTADGLPSSSVRGILFDSADTVWLVGGDSANGGGILRLVP